MATIHIPEGEAARNFEAVMAHVRAGAEVVIESNAKAVAVVKPAEQGPGRLLSESLRLAKERGSQATLDARFSADLETVINSHPEPLNPPPWD
jgi:antitoxin (DNA-binding transcriptional repressor) of toxin-antitoxin stability system